MVFGQPRRGHAPSQGAAGSQKKKNELLLTVLSLTTASAFQLAGAAPRMMKAPLRTSTPPTMLVPDVPTLASLPTTLIADDTSSLLLASGALFSFLFLFIVVGTVVVNFGIMPAVKRK